jgi:hypothetical protein
MQLAVLLASAALLALPTAHGTFPRVLSYVNCLKICSFAHLGPLSDAHPASFNFLVVGDWGGQDTPPYTTPGEIAAAGGMAAISSALNAKFVIGLGDNFYYTGAPRSCVTGGLMPQGSRATMPTSGSM